MHTHTYQQWQENKSEQKRNHGVCSPCVRTSLSLSVSLSIFFFYSVCEYCMRIKSMGIFCAIAEYRWIVVAVVVVPRCHLFQSFCMRLGVCIFFSLAQRVICCALFLCWNFLVVHFVAFAPTVKTDGERRHSSIAYFTFLFSIHSHNWSYKLKIERKKKKIQLLKTTEHRETAKLQQKSVYILNFKR